MNGKSRSPRKILRGIKHGRAGYNKGCGCRVCETDAKAYGQYYRQCRNGTVKGDTSFETWKRENGYLDEEPSTIATVTALPTNGEVSQQKSRVKVPVIKEMEEAVIKECEGLSLATERPAMVMAARNMARILDDPKKAALHATANRQMTSILNDLRGGSKRKAKGRLAAVKKMTEGSRAMGT